MYDNTDVAVNSDNNNDNSTNNDTTNATNNNNSIIHISYTNTHTLIP